MKGFILCMSLCLLLGFHPIKKETEKKKDNLERYYYKTKHKTEFYRMVYDSTTSKVIMILNSDGYTMTKYKMECYTSLAECYNRIDSLDLDTLGAIIEQ